MADSEMLTPVFSTGGATMRHYNVPVWLYMFSLSLCFLFLTGCIYAAAFVPEVIQLGAHAFGALEFEDVKANLGPGVTPEQLRKIKKVALVFGPIGGQQMEAFQALGGGGLTSTFSDNLAIELMGMGFEVVEREQLAKVMNEQALQMSGVAEADKAIAAGKILAVDAIVTGSVKSGQDISMGVMGVGAGVHEVVKSATVKVLGVEKANVMLAMAVTYKKGQNADSASRALAKLLKEKLSGTTGEKAEAAKE